MTTKELMSLIKDEREKRELTRRDVAEILGISYAYYSQFENPSYMPNMEILQNVCLLLELDFEKVSANLERCEGDVEFCRILTEARQAKEWDIKYVARLLDVSKQTIKHWECGKLFPNLRQVHRLAEVYEIPVDTLCRCRGYYDRGHTWVEVARLKHGYTQRDMCKMLGVCLKNYSDWEHSVVFPRKYVETIEKALEIKIPEDRIRQNYRK